MWRIFLPAVVLALVFGCGEADLNPPGSWGVEKTNTLVLLDFSGVSTEVDLCDPAPAPALVNVTTEIVNPDLPENTLYLERYTLKYTPLVQAAPSIEGAAVDLALNLPVEGLPLRFIGSALKERLRRDVAAEMSYTARYTFSGRDRYGSGWGAAGGFSFTVSRVAGCTPEALAISPASLSVAGIKNSDGDPTDDVTFYISGGSAPYKVFSNNPGVINSPGELLAGEASFTIDPDAVTSVVTVTLTVLDSESVSASAEVTVTPSSTPTPLSISPAKISLAGLPNTDGDPTDDVTFYISGGSTPYKVFSDNPGVINSPGALSAGETSFTIDPDSVGSTVTVKLTVVDSEGASISAEVAVTPFSAQSPLFISPAGISLTGLQNPDGDLSDDVTFYISGGDGPYQVFSSKDFVISAPGPLAFGETSFTLDPGIVLTAETVTITVEDSSGRTAEAVVTVNPL